VSVLAQHHLAIRQSPARLIFATHLDLEHVLRGIVAD
jgi:hypothetical protein